MDMSSPSLRPFCPFRPSVTHAVLCPLQFFNTNNLWIRLDKLREYMDSHNGIIPLPMISNKKTVNPKVCSGRVGPASGSASGSALGSASGPVLGSVSE